MRQAAINAALLPLTEAQTTRMGIRIAMFSKRGLSQFHAEALADRLAYRDQDLDSRRVCAECGNYIHEFKCAKRQPVLMDTLQHCPAFAWQLPTKK